jgi:hypothetical protein
MRQSLDQGLTLFHGLCTRLPSSFCLRVESLDLEKIATTFLAMIRDKRTLQDHIIASLFFGDKIPLIKTITTMLLRRIWHHQYHIL